MELTLAVIGVIAGVVSIILGGFAIWLSFQFYDKSNKVDTSVQTALEGIRAQTNTLQSITGKHLERLTKFVTTPRNESAQTSQILEITLREIPDLIQRLQPATQATSDPVLRGYLTSAYIALWNYTGTTNIWGAYGLPNAEDFDEDERNHTLARQIVDRSAADFRYVQATIIAQISDDEIRASPLFHMYEEALRFVPATGDTVEVFARRAQQG
jgi:hypothetical protein